MTTTPTFWKIFSENFYEKNPCILNLREAGGCPFNEAQALEVIKRSFSREHGKAYVPQERRLHINFKPVSGQFIENCDLPQEDETLISYLERIYKVVGAEDLTMVAHNCQRFDQSIYNSAKDFLRPLFELTGVPAKMVGTDLFAGKYRTGPNTIHKDTGGVLVFPLIRTKSIVCWPFEHFGHLAPGAKYKNAGLPGLKVQDHLEGATVLTAEPGEAIYFPSNWWHSAYSSDLEPNCTLNITLYLASTAESLVLPITEKLLKQIDEEENRIDHLFFNLDASEICDIDSVELNPALQGIGTKIERALRLQQLRKLTSAGFMTPSSDHSCRPIPSEMLRGNSNYPILLVKDGNRSLLIANGCILECRHSDEVLNCVALINSGSPFFPGDLKEPKLLQALYSCGSIFPLH